MNEDRARSDQHMLAVLAKLVPVPAERDLPEGRSATLKEHLMHEVRQADSKAHGMPRVPRRRRNGLWAAVGGAVTAATATAVTVSALTLPATDPAPGRHHPGGNITSTRQYPPGNAAAVQLLAMAANAAAHQSIPVVHDNQYAYIETEIVRQPQSGCLLQVRGGKCRPIHLPPIPRHKRQIWLSVSNLCRPGLLNEPAAGSTSMKLVPGWMYVSRHHKVRVGGCPNRGSLNDPTYRFLQSLPTDPRALLALIYRKERGDGNSPAQQAFTTIGDLLDESFAPPAVSAALYRAAALIPGVRVVHQAVDVMGRHGIAVAFSDINAHSSSSGAATKNRRTGIRSEWIFDRVTFQWLGEREVAIPSGRQIFADAILQRAIVDRPGQVPARH